MNKKIVSPVIAVMLLVAVACAAVGAYFIWYKSFQEGSQKMIEEETIERIEVDIEQYKEKLDAIKTTIKRIKSESTLDTINRYEIKWRNKIELGIYLTYDYREIDPFKILTKTMIEYADYISYEETYYSDRLDQRHYIVYLKCEYKLNEEDIAEILIDN